MSVVIEKYSADRLESCLALLADAFVSNPLHVAVFGPQRSSQIRTFFRIGLRRMFTGPAFVALVDGTVRGYMHFKPSPYCLPAPEEVPMAAATLLKPLDEAMPRLIKWLSRWCHLDPDEPHVHLGPLAVSPDAQRTGVGTALMNRYTECLQKQRAAGYLETDRLESVRFYQKFGFVVQREEELIGAPVWYMWRLSDR